jgi:hypothetical protein
MTGPEEWVVVRDSGMTDRSANPEHLLRMAKMQPMSVARLLETVLRPCAPMLATIS